MKGGVGSETSSEMGGEINEGGGDGEGRGGGGGEKKEEDYEYEYDVGGVYM